MRFYRQSLRFGPWCASVGGLLALSILLVSECGSQEPLGSLQPRDPQVLAQRSAAAVKPITQTRPASAPRLVETYGKLPLSFEVNQGQTDGQVKFLSRGRGYTLFLTGNEAVLTLRKPSAASPQLSATGKGMASAMPLGVPPNLRALAPEGRRGAAQHFPQSGTAASPTFFESPARTPAELNLEKPQGQTTDPALQEPPPAPAVLRLKLLGANPNPKLVGLDELSGKSNYFIGNDPKKWRTNVPNYARVRYENVYPGIDLVYYGNQRQLEYDFVVAPGADPNAIVLEIDGAVAAVSDRRPAMGSRRGDPLQIDSNGDLVITTDTGEVRFHKPLVYQPVAALYERRSSIGGDTPPLQPANPKPQIENRKSIDGRFVLRVSNPKSKIENPKYEVSFELASYDPRLPLVIDPTLSYSTYLGGSDNDSPGGIAVDSAGNAYVVGTTSSQDFPTAGPPSGLHAPPDVFVTKLNAAGSGLVCSVYLGGGSYDGGYGIALDATGNIYVTGQTSSSDFPTTPPVLKDTLTDYSDAFVTKINASCAGLDYSTFLGGTLYEWGDRIVVDSAGNAYVVGITGSLDFPTTEGTYDATFNEQGDLFVAKLDATAVSLLYGTYLGGSYVDHPYTGSLAVDSSGSIYVGGFTNSPDFPTTPNAFDRTCGTDGACNPINGYPWFYDAFLAKIDPSQGGADSLVYSTYIGGSWSDVVTEVAVDASAVAYVAGFTGSPNFRTTSDAFQPIYGGKNCPTDPEWCADAFVMKIDPTKDGAASLLYSTYLGGSLDDLAFAMALDTAGNIYVTGRTYSNDFPLASPTQATLGGGTCYGTPPGPESYPCYDAFVSKLNPSGSGLIFSTYLGGDKSSESVSVIAVDSAGSAYVGGYPGTCLPTTSGAFQTSSVGGTDAFVAKYSMADNTPAGSNVAVPLTSKVSVTYDSVSSSGTTAVTQTSSGPTPPSGFSLGDPPTYYDLSTTATFSGLITVCINYAGITFEDETNLTLLHFEEGAWVDRTVSLNTVNKIICASVTSLSPFAVFEAELAGHIQPPIEADGSSVFNARRGVVPVKFALTLGGAPTCELPPATIALFRTGANDPGPVSEAEYMMAADNGSNFRITDCQYHYNLATSSLGAGTYQVEIRIGGTAVGTATFGLK